MFQTDNGIPFIGRRMKNIYHKLIVTLLISLLIISCSNNIESIDKKEDMFMDATVSYLGPEGTYTQEASEYFFSDAKKMIAKESVDKAIESVLNNECNFAVIPQENTLGGAVTNYVDALIANENIYIVGEIIIPISQTLMGLQDSDIKDIKTVYSHAQGIIQSEKWRKENMSDVEVKESTSTAAAASFVAQSGDKTIAAIAAPKAAEIYGLKILAENVQITTTNKTRFYVVSKEKLSGKKTNAVLVARCHGDFIDDIIVKIHNANLELVSIHDRPKGDELGSYNYIIEVINKDGISDKQIEVINSIEEVSLLGCFNVIEK